MPGQFGRPPRDGPVNRAAARRGDTAGGDLTLRTLAGLKWAFLASAAQALLSLGIVMVLARLLTPEDFGVVAIAQAAVALAATIGRHGLGPALIQRFELTARHLAEAHTLSLAAAAALAAAIWALAPWASGALGEPGAAAAMRVLALVTLIAGAGVVPEHRLRRALRFGALMAVSIAAKVLGYGLVAIGLAVLEQGVWALAWGLVAQQAVFTAAALALAPPPESAGAAARERAELVVSGAGFSAVAMLGVSWGQTVRILIAGLFGAGALGLYTRANSLALVNARLAPVLGSVLLPAMARRQRHTGRLREVYLNGAEILSFAAFPASLLIALLAPEIVAAVLGPGWEAAAPVLRLLALAGAAQALRPLSVPAIRALGALWRESWRRALSLALAAAALWFASRWGLGGAVAALCAAAVLLNLLLVHLALRLLGVRPAALAARLAPALWTALGAGAALWPAAQAAREAGWPPAGTLAAGLAAWGAGALAAVWFAPRFARPAFHHWGLARLPFADLGRAARPLRGLLERLARRWPAAQCA